MMDFRIISRNISAKHKSIKRGRLYFVMATEGRTKKEPKSTHLPQILDEMIKKNGGTHYSNQIYKDAQPDLQRKIPELKSIEILENQIEVEQFVSKFKDK